MDKAEEASVPTMIHEPDSSKRAVQLRTSSQTLQRPFTSARLMFSPLKGADPVVMSYGLSDSILSLFCTYIVVVYLLTLKQTICERRTLIVSLYHFLATFSFHLWHLPSSDSCSTRLLIVLNKALVESKEPWQS